MWVIGTKLDEYKDILAGQFLNTLQGNPEEQVQQFQRKDEVIDDRLCERKAIIENEFRAIKKAKFEDIVFVAKSKSIGTVKLRIEV